MTFVAPRYLSIEHVVYTAFLLKKLFIRAPVLLSLSNIDFAPSECNLTWYLTLTNLTYGNLR